MKKIDFNYDEYIYEEKLKNGISVYLYPTNKSKNFYITVSTHFGAEVMKYKKGKKVYEVTKGSAHFLEHRVMDFTKNKEAAKKINELGSLVNAYTTYNGTNYNLFGTENILENITLLFDRVFKAHIKEEDVESEKGIILEEYSMYNSDPYYKAQTGLLANMFHNGFLKYTVLGTEEGIKRANEKELTRLYKDFYVPDNMFIVVCGSFNKDEVMDYINKYMEDVNIPNSKSEVIIPKESDSVYSEYEEITENLSEPKVVIGYKIRIPSIKEKRKFKLMLEMILSENFDKTGKSFLRFIENNIPRFEYSIEECDNHIALYFLASTKEYEKFIKILEEELMSLEFDKDSLERKKKALLSSVILGFEDIINVEDIITSNLFSYNKLPNDIEEVVNSIKLSEVKDAIKSINLDNKNLLIMKE